MKYDLNNVTQIAVWSDTSVQLCKESVMVDEIGLLQSFKSSCLVRDTNLNKTRFSFLPAVKYQRQLPVHAIVVSDDGTAASQTEDSS